MAKDAAKPYYRPLMVRTLASADTGCDAGNAGGDAGLNEQALSQCLICGGLQMAEKPRIADLPPAYRGVGQQKGQQIGIPVDAEKIDASLRKAPAR